MENIIQLVKEKELIQDKLDDLVYGAVEIREQLSKKYIYVHIRNKGKLVTKYVGEYNKALFNKLNNNNIIAKLYKSRLRDINKKLNKLEYSTVYLKDKVKLNIDLARRSMVDLIYKQAKLEGVATTYSQTETIVNGGKVNDLSASDITKVINLKHAWEFILSEGVICYPTNYALLTQINGIVQESLSYFAGKIRSIPVSISGTNYIPPIPFETIVKEDLNKILSSNLNSFDKTIELLLYVMKKQIFIDGNKRTAVIFANHYLINQGLGLVVIPDKLVDEFRQLLVDYYEEKNDKIKTFLLNECLIKVK